MMPFQIHRSVDHEAMSRAAAARIVAQLRRKPDSLLILATGATPERTYELLAQQGRAQPGLCEHMRILKLDEWGGLSMDDPATCETALRRTLIESLGIGADRYWGWQSAPADIQGECHRIEQFLYEHGPADLCVLGLGLNGHLGFNEPDSHVRPSPHRAELSRQSLRHSMLQQARGQPGFGLTLGLRDILLSREILLLVSGVQKQSQLCRLLRPEIAPQFPASFLWLHSTVDIYCDEDAFPVQNDCC